MVAQVLGEHFKLILLAMATVQIIEIAVGFLPLWFPPIFKPHSLALQSHCESSMSRQSIPSF